MPVVVTSYPDTGTALDLLTLAEAKKALPSITTETNYDAELALYITAISRYLDDLCGAIVLRTVTNEMYEVDGQRVVFLRWAPCSRTSITTVTSITEYRGGVPTVLTAEQLTTSTGNDYLFDPVQGSITRRSSWRDYLWSAGTRIAVTYNAGRYTSTAAVDAKFKKAAQVMLQNEWRRDLGGGTVTLGSYDTGPSGIPTFALPNAVKAALGNEMLPPNVA